MNNESLPSKYEGDPDLELEIPAMEFEKHEVNSGEPIVSAGELADAKIKVEQTLEAAYREKLLKGDGLTAEDRAAKYSTPRPLETDYVVASLNKNSTESQGKPNAEYFALMKGFEAEGKVGFEAIKAANALKLKIGKLAFIEKYGAEPSLNYQEKAA